VNDAISITLSRTQINHVLRLAAREQGIVGALSGLPDRDKLAEAYRSLDGDGPQLSRSLLIGLIVFTCFPEDGDTLGVSEVAKILGLRTSSAFRYIATLLAAGLLERDPKTRRYSRLPAQPHERQSRCSAPRGRVRS
jgi:DNA-binding MarR family transcriptional regulator